MRLRRRHFLQLAAGALALPGFFHTAGAQAYPTRPVRLLVPSPPGGLADTLARLMGEWLAGRLRQPFVIENKSGASNNIAAEAVANAAPDGHTLLITNPAHFLNGALYERLNFNFDRDIAPVAGLLRAPNVMEVHPSVPAKSVPEFIA
jgi:tripartite-type tricarboxylate transporter receptor subunit TctC